MLQHGTSVDGAAHSFHRIPLAPMKLLWLMLREIQEPLRLPGVSKSVTRVTKSAAAVLTSTAPSVEDPSHLLQHLLDSISSNARGDVNAAVVMGQAK